MSGVMRIEDPAREGRFARFELISWWDQKRLANAKVLVIGAGALGNEVIKNLALLGVGHIFVADLDLIEQSNLTRSVLYRARDCGRAKAEVAAERAGDIYPDVRSHFFHGNIVYDLGLGIYRWADVIIGGLDNREARVAINSAAARTGRLWIDGAIERLDGVARVFDPATGPCYECTMGEADWKMLEARRSCALLSRAEMEQGKVPTTPTTSSVVAGIQCQEALKYLHGRDMLSGQGFVFDGTNHESYRVTYTRKADCPAHDAFDPIEEMPWSAATTTGRALLEKARADLGSDAVVEFNQDLLSSLVCAKCNKTEPMYASLGKVTEAQGRCPHCKEHRIPETYHTLSGEEPFLDRTLQSLGVPPWDIIGARGSKGQKFYEFSKDRALVLGPMANAISDRGPA